MKTEKFWKNLFKTRDDIGSEESEKIIEGVANLLQERYNYTVTDEDRSDILKILLTNNIFSTTIENITKQFLNYVGIRRIGIGP